ncbi:efflux RND transporter periplasmic adaptor subunit [Sporomusa sp.]|uniref:efflux RND transporter periplasmic adaptor subunit n=1 Tax=Sporomusa sp. TaxID=2078658 RepID=UPI002D14411E|nr:efflux RND transporter periplasmic adaptor subunit [Sporomusa sp.]HWR42880.1 efflux RND transporter periplasmic adaptor subunit [Sporomusa sp.]
MLFANNKRLAIGLAVVVALTGVVGYRIYANIAGNKARASQMTKVQAAAVEVAPVGRRDITPLLVFPANLEPVWSADISAKVDGRINVLSVNEGDIIEAGAVIAELDTSELAAQVVQAEGNLMAAKSSLEQAQLDYWRYSTLAGQGAVSAQMLDTARTKRDLSAGQVRSAEGNVMLLQEKLGNATVTAPKHGVVTKRFFQAGTFVRAGSAIVTVADTTTLLAKATVGESQIDDLTVGAVVKVKVDALGGQEFSGTVTRLSPVASTPARTFAAEITIPNDQGSIKAGMFAKVAAPAKVHQGVVAVPESALVLKEDQKTVFVVTADNKVQQRTLKLGYMGDGWAEVLDGVSAGETIVVAGQNKVKDGMSITPVQGGDK